MLYLGEIELEKTENKPSETVKPKPKRLSYSLKLEEFKQFSFQTNFFKQFDFKPGRPRRKQTLVFPKPKTPISLSIYDIDSKIKLKNRRSIENVVEPPKSKPESLPYDERVRIFQDFSKLRDLTNRNQYLKQEIMKYDNYFAIRQPSLNTCSSCPVLPSITSNSQTDFTSPKLWRRDTIQPSPSHSKKRVKTYDPTSKRPRKSISSYFM
ncbi:unnamed protein product [Blepharisma stoltei]|uniref:Uncharacterized protein n=1 Tax=Blepharisma stoltei TaxID=1481888 RepID=A0AAU9K0X2_9CILI|nr:unnamed protein product [Blepharisma stoltei]